MEIHSGNRLNTTTMVSVDYGSDTVRYLFDGNSELKWRSTGFTMTGSAAVINVSFTASTILSHIFIRGHNIDELYVYYDNTTTNCLYFTCDNRDPDLYIGFNSVTVGSIQVVMGRTFPMGQTRRIGDLALVERLFTTDKDPSIRDFAYMLDREQAVHEMPDGGISAYNLRDNFKAKIRWRFITSALHTQFLDVFEDAIPFHVVLKPTDTAWDGMGFEVDWIGKFDFKPSMNNTSQGYTGTMDLRQTSRARS